MYFLQIFTYSLVSFLGIVFVEHLLRVFNLKYRPSYFLDKTIIYLRNFFESLGRLLARLSSFYVYFKLDEFFMTMWDIFLYIIVLLTTPLYILYGYVITAVSYSSPMLVYFGSSTVLIILSLLVYRYFEHIPYLSIVIDFIYYIFLNYYFAILLIFAGIVLYVLILTIERRKEQYFNPLLRDTIEKDNNIKCYAPRTSRKAKNNVE